MGTRNDVLAQTPEQFPSVIVAAKMADKSQPRQEPRPEPKPGNGKTAKNGGHTIPAQMI